MSVINKRSLAWILYCVFVWSGFMCSVATAGARKRTADDYFTSANVSFDVQKSARGVLTITGHERGVEKFREQIPSSDLAGFRRQRTGNFNLTRLRGELLRFAYKGFSINIAPSGNIMVTARGEERRGEERRGEERRGEERKNARIGVI